MATPTIAELELMYGNSTKNLNILVGVQDGTSNLIPITVDATGKQNVNVSGISFSGTLNVDLDAIDPGQPTNRSSSVQTGGTTDGTFHATDASTSNTKPLRMFDISGGGTHYVQGVSLRTGAGVEFGTLTTPLYVNVTNGSGGGASQADNSTYTQGTTTFTPIGGEYTTTPSALTDGRAGAAQVTANRALHTNLRNASGTEIGTAGAPVRVDPTGTTTQPVSVASLPLPTGASTEATLALIKAKTDNLDVLLSTRTKPSDTQTVSGTITANIGTSGSLALDATLAKLTITQGTALGANTQALMGASVTTAAPAYTTGQISPLSLTTTGLLRVDGSGATQPVSGTVTANAGTNLNTSALALDTSVSGLSLAQNATTSGQKGVLSQGAVTTAAPAYTTAQTSPLSLTTAGALRVDGSAVTQPVSLAANQSVNLTQVGGSTISATVPVSARLTDGTAFYTKTGQTAGAAEFVQLSDGAAAVGTSGNPLRVDPTGTTTQPVSITGNQAVNVAQINGVTTSVNNGVAGTGVQRVVIASDQTAYAIKFSQTTTDNDVDVVSEIPGTGATNLGKAEDAAHTSGDTGVFALGVRNDTNATFTSADSDYSPIAVDLAGSPRVVGNIASGTADAGNPVKVGFEARTTNPTAVTDGQRVNARADKLGRAIYVLNQMRDQVTDSYLALTSTSDTTVMAGAAAIFHDLTLITVSNAGATTQTVTIKDNGTTRMVFSVAANGLGVVPMNVPLKQATVNTAWTAAGSTGTPNLHVTMQAVNNI